MHVFISYLFFVSTNEILLTSTPNKKTEMDFEAKETTTPSPKWKSVVLLFGGTILIMIMVHAMQDAMQLSNDSSGKAKASFTGEVIAITATALQNEYVLNEDSTSKKYKDKQVLVTGKIAEVDKYRTGESFIVLEESDRAKNIKLQCGFKKESAIDTLSKGHNITIQGAPTFIKNVILIENSQVKK
jgi:hypothetical protein